MLPQTHKSLQSAAATSSSLSFYFYNYFFSFFFLFLYSSLNTFGTKLHRKNSSAMLS